jgi:hypothetical protein
MKNLAAWQLSPANTTIMFRVASPGGSPIASSESERERIIYLGPCVGSHEALEG